VLLSDEGQGQEGEIPSGHYCVWSHCRLLQDWQVGVGRAAAEWGCCMHCIFYVYHMDGCTTWGIDWGGGVGGDSYPNLLSLNDVWDHWEGFGSGGAGNSIAHGHKGGHGGLHCTLA